VSPKFAASSKKSWFSGAIENRLALSVVVTAFVLVSIIAANMLTVNTTKARVTSPEVITAQATQTKPISQTATEAGQPKLATMSQTPPKQIDPGTIDRIAGSGSSNIIVFKDGSSMALDAFTLEQLPAEIRKRISYSQGPSQLQPDEARRPGGSHAR
jgi:hypothetical protein